MVISPTSRKYPTRLLSAREKMKLGEDEKKTQSEEVKPSSTEPHFWVAALVLTQWLFKEWDGVLTLCLSPIGFVIVFLLVRIPCLLIFRRRQGPKLIARLLDWLGAPFQEIMDSFEEMFSPLP